MPTKAQEILRKFGSYDQKIKWAEGNCVRREHDSQRGFSAFYFSDGSKIIDLSGRLRAA